MNILANLWKNAPRWRFFVIAAFLFTIVGLLKKYFIPLSPPPPPPPPPPPCQTNPNDPRCTICSPSNLSGSYKKDSDPANPIIVLEWGAAGSNVQQYILQRKKIGESSYSDINKYIAQPATQLYRYEDRVVFGSDYNYQIVADCGNNKSSSNVKTIDMTPSYKITEFEVEGDEKNLSIINLEWNGVGDYDLTGFLVKRKMGKNDQQWREIKKMSVSERTRIYKDRDKALKPGMEYCYQVVPKLVDGTEGGASDVQCYTMPLPAPKKLKAERTPQGVRLTWEWPEDSLNDVDQFVIYSWEYRRKSKSQAKKIEIRGKKEYLDEKANNPRVEYFYTVLAIDQQSREGFAAQIDVE